MKRARPPTASDSFRLWVDGTGSMAAAGATAPAADGRRRAQPPQPGAAAAPRRPATDSAIFLGDGFPGAGAAQSHGSNSEDALFDVARPGGGAAKADAGGGAGGEAAPCARGCFAPRAPAGLLRHAGWARDPGGSSRAAFTAESAWAAPQFCSSVHSFCMAVLTLRVPRAPSQCACWCGCATRTWSRCWARCWTAHGQCVFGF